ncbi:retrovirus-related pol polyprotein from transposon TNT 1-94 [Tanacetum coccineum]
MATLAKHIIIAGAENRPPMLEKSMFDSWASRICLFIKGMKHGRMMLDSINNGSLVYPTIEEDGQTRPKKYSELTKAQQLQDECDVQATNIILHDVPPDVYAFVNHQEEAKDIWDIFLNALPPEWSKFVTDVKLAKNLYTTNYDQLYAYLSQHERQANEATIKDERVTVQQVQGRQTQSFAGTGNRGIATTSRGNYAVGQPREKLMLVKAQEAGQILDEDQLAFIADLGINEALAKSHLMANISSYDSDVLSEVPYSDSYPNDMVNQDVQEMSYSEQTHIDDFQDNEIHCDSNIIPYSQYLQESQNTEEAIWLKHSNYNPDTSVKSHKPVRIEAPSKLPKVSLVNESLKRLKYQLTNFDKVVKKRTKSDAITADEITEVQTVFNQMEAAVDQCSVDKNAFEIQIKQLSIDNDQLLKQIMSQEIVHIVVNYVDILYGNKSRMDEFNKCLELETGLLKKKDLIEKDVYDKLLKSYSTLEKHCISLELTTQLNQEIFQKDNFCENQNAPTFNQLFEINELKAQSQEKDTVMRKLKHMIKSLSGKDSVKNVKKDIDEIETINIELEHNQFDSIRKTRVQSKEECASLIAQINAKSVENSDLNAQLQEKIFAIVALKNELRKLKGKNVVDTTVSKPSATIAPGMFKLDIEPISHRLKNNRNAHEVYLEKTIEDTDTLRGLVECARKQNPIVPLLEFACMFTKHVQELLVYVSKTCPSLTKPTEKLVVVTPMNKEKKVRFAELVTSSSNIPKQTDSLRTKDSNKPLLTFTGVNTTTSASGSKPSSNTKKNRISRSPSSNQKKKVEENPRKVKSSLNKTNFVFEPISNAHVKHFVRNAKFEYICVICNKCLFDANYDMCVIDYVKDVNVRKTFTIVGNKCPLTRITSTKVMPTKETIKKSVLTPTQVIIVYSRKPKALRSVVSSSKVKIVESKTSNTKEPKQSWGSTISNVTSSSLNDCRLWRLSNGKCYNLLGLFLEGSGHNLFSVGQFCDSDLEVAFRKHTCFIRDLDGVDVLKGSRGSNLYTLSMDNLLLSSPICLLSKALKTKSWLWHQRLSYLNFDYITSLAKQSLARGLPKLKYQKDHLCSACALGRSSHDSLLYSKQIINLKTSQQTPYELLHDRKPDLSYLHVFGALLYPTNDGEDLGKLKPKADIGIFVGYAPAKKAF